MSNSSSSIWRDAIAVKKALAADGWVSPDTYDRYFEPVAEIPAVYLFLLTKEETFREALVAYVGMSEQLSVRLSGHPVLREIARPGFWPQRWFKPTPQADLRRVESKYITTFDPPWNVQGRTRGVRLI